MLTQSYLKSILSYCPESGILIWLERPRSMFSSDRSWNAWNARFSGRKAGADDKNGYIQVKINGKLFKAHRIIWVIIHGGIPDEIDHINGNGQDNRESNLRNVSHKENGRNIKLPSNNSTGHIGITMSGEKFRARISVDGKSKSLGIYDDLGDAANARKLADKKFNFHENHGRAQ